MTRHTTSNPLGVPALVWVGDTSLTSIDHAIRKTKDPGLDLLEFSLRDAANLDVTQTRTQLEQAGLHGGPITF